MPASTSSDRAPRRGARRAAAACAALALLAAAGAARAGDEEGCLDCHALAGFAVRADGAARSLAVSGERFESSAHGALGCRECHADIASIPHGESVRPVACGQPCHGAARGGEAAHEKIWWEHAASVHGAEAPGSTGCLVCHPAPAPPGERDRMDEARRCASCHRGSPDVIAWFADRHGRALAAGDPRAPSCPDCHTSHRVRPAADGESSVSGPHLAATCSGGALGGGNAASCHGTLAAASVAGARMNQLPRGGSRGGLPGRLFDLLFAGLVAGLAVRAAVGFARER